MPRDRLSRPLVSAVALLATATSLGLSAEARPVAPRPAASARPPASTRPPASARPPATPPAPASPPPPATASAEPGPESPDVQPPPAPGAENIGAPPANAISTNAVAQLGTFDAGGTFFGHLGFGASYDRPAIAGTLGAKLQLSPGWMVGLDAEWNPWISLDTKKIRNGVFNVYASVVRRYQMRYEAVNLRTTAGIGASALLFDLYGARSGSVGPFLGVSVLGIEWKLAKNWYFVFDPAYIAFTVPHVTGVPLGYLQYRVVAGLDVAFF